METPTGIKPAGNDLALVGPCGDALYKLQLKKFARYT